MRSDAKLDRRIADVVTIEAQSDVITVRLVYGPTAPLGLKIHHGARDAATRLLMRRSTGQISADQLSCRFPSSEKQLAYKLAGDLYATLASFSQRPMTPRQVESVLGISATERNRWCRQGRLVRSGQAKIRRGLRTISIWTYSTPAVEALVRNPTQLQRWREDDEP